jgi:cell division protein ZapD
MKPAYAMETSSRTSAATTITFEQPISETIRLCLRLEHLFHQFHQHVDTGQPASVQLALMAILRLQQMTDRPDLKSKITQALSQHSIQLNSLSHYPGVDGVALARVLHQLEQTLQALHATRHKIAEQLRKNHFLCTLASQLHDPAGLTSWGNASYGRWQHYDSSIQSQHLHHWFQDYQVLEQAVILVLQLTRESAEPQSITIHQGYYQRALDSQTPCQLIQLSIPAQLDIHPEISASKHHLSIRFLHTQHLAGGQNQPYSEDFNALLCCCR